MAKCIRGWGTDWKDFSNWLVKSYVPKAKALQFFSGNRQWATPFSASGVMAKDYARQSAGPPEKSPEMISNEQVQARSSSQRVYGDRRRTCSCLYCCIWR